MIFKEGLVNEALFFSSKLVKHGSRGVKCINLMGIIVDRPVRKRELTGKVVDCTRSVYQ